MGKQEETWITSEWTNRREKLDPPCSYHRSIHIAFQRPIPSLKVKYKLEDGKKRNKWYGSGRGICGRWVGNVVASASEEQPHMRLESEPTEQGRDRQAEAGTET